MNPMELAKALIPFQEGESLWLSFGKILVALALIIIFWVKGMQRVEAGTVALRTRFGKVVMTRQKVIYRRGVVKRVKRVAGIPIVRQPGLVIGIPFVHSLVATSSQVRQLELRPLKSHDKSGLVVNQVWIVNFQIVDIYKALIEYQDVEGQIRSMCEEHIRLLLSKNESIKRIKRCMPRRRQILRDSATYGVELKEFRCVSENLAENQILTEPRPQTGRALKFRDEVKAARTRRRTAANTRRIVTARRKAPPRRAVARTTTRMKVVS